MKVVPPPASVRARLLAAALLLLWPLLATAEEGHSRAGTIDPLVSEIVAMLEGDVPARIVRQWLEDSNRRPGELGADELVALTEAGADEELLARVLELAAAGGAAGAEAVETAGEAVAEAEPGTAATGPSAAEEPTPALVRHSVVDVFFTLNYRPKWAKDEPRWDLFLYLDGEILARVPANDDRTLVVLRRLQSGWHRLVVAQETHERRPGASPIWTHASRVSTVPIDFMLPAADNLEVEVVFRQFMRKRSQRGPIHLKVLQGIKQLERQEQAGAPLGQWLPFCEDLETDAGSGGVDEPCARWSELWGDTAAPDFAAMRMELARFDFAPPPLP